MTIRNPTLQMIDRLCEGVEIEGYIPCPSLVMTGKFAGDKRGERRTVVYKQPKQPADITSLTIPGLDRVLTARSPSPILKKKRMIWK